MASSISDELTEIGNAAAEAAIGSVTRLNRLPGNRRTEQHTPANPPREPVPVTP